MERAQSSPTIGEIVNDERYRSIFYQILVFGVVAWVVYTLVGNTQDNLARRGMTAGFDFLGATAGFAIAWTPLDYKPNDSYLYVYWVGIVNTLLLSSVAIVLSTILGFFVGILRLSKNWLVSQLASWYVEFLRNTPLLLQIIFWYLGAFANLPRPKKSIELFGIDWLVLYNRGFYFPKGEAGELFWLSGLALIVGIILAIWFNKRATKKQQQTGQYIPTLLPTLGLIIILPALMFLITGMPLEWQFPELKGFNYRGGVFILPSMCSVLVALVIYHSAYAAEMVRAGPCG